MPRLLILDDDPVMREIIAVLAERQGFSTRLCAQAEDFFGQLDQWDPTHLSIDLMMPTHDGIEVLRELAQRNCRAAVVIVSCMAQKVLDSARRVAVERGLNIIGVLAKPFRHDALRELLGLAVPGGSHPRAAQAQYAGLAINRQIVAEALRERQFALCFQPKIRLNDGALIGVEVLVRWQHPLLGMIGPDRFVAEFERLDMIGELTLRVIDDALRWFAAANLPAQTTMAINLSARDLGNLDLADRIHASANALSIDPARVVLELTETGAMTHPESALATLTRLRIMGFGLALDDFGTGYSSMVQLARLPFSSMKIDKSFVGAMLESAEARKIVLSIISLGHSLGLDIVAEGVESAACAALLCEYGCDAAQGYAIAAPMDAAALARWQRQWDGAAFLGGQQALGARSSVA